MPGSKTFKRLLQGVWACVKAPARPGLVAGLEPPIDKRVRYAALALGTVGLWVVWGEGLKGLFMNFMFYLIVFRAAIEPFIYKLRRFLISDRLTLQGAYLDNIATVFGFWQLLCNIAWVYCLVMVFVTSWYDPDVVVTYAEQVEAVVINVAFYVIPLLPYVLLVAMARLVSKHKFGNLIGQSAAIFFLLDLIKGALTFALVWSITMLL